MNNYVKLILKNDIVELKKVFNSQVRSKINELMNAKKVEIAKSLLKSK